MPTGVEPIQLSDRRVEVPKCSLRFRPWTGPAIEDDYGGKPVLDVDGEPVFAELAILRLLREGGWEGVWVDTFRQRFLTGLPSRTEAVPLPKGAALVYGTIQQQAGTRSGCWDVFAWRQPGSYRFVEAKWRDHDRIRTSQVQWFEAARKVGFQAESFLVVEWELVSA
jgi:hypothetical protein